MKSNLKQKLKSGDTTIGSWITFSDPAIAEIMAKSGFDWLAIDMEHSSLSFTQAQQIIRVVDLCGVTPLVRVMDNNPNLIKRFMDAGAHGIIVPMINTQEEAKRAVSAVKYPPLGKRGVGLSRAQNYSLDFDSYYEWNQENSLVIVQVEHIKAIENLESIMEVEGVDGFFIGPYDLSSSLNCTGNFEHPKMIAAMELVIKKSKDNGYVMGQHIVNPIPEHFQQCLKKGITFIAYGVDFLFIGEKIRNDLKIIK
ncbi:MAG: 2,4-dihydroxyhept-2-ene-1,7-dioic acid aldolase [Flavobacteriales bacterium]|jgi:2-keto-3-deoxy-L-rhamnonate aldolase RhmA|nr:2,4-dihydroxyhept-2-ene-1,7-dioic acid aldolase [Flavobacteriales bacterium]